MSLWAFRFVLWYICILFVQPQNRFEFLYPLHIANLSIIIAVVFHAMAALSEGRPIIRFGPCTVTMLLLLAASFVSLYLGPLQASGAWNPYIDIIAKNAIVAILIEATAFTVDRVWAVQMTLYLGSLWWVKAGLRLSAAGATSTGDRLMGPAVSLVENSNGFAYMMCLLLPFYLYVYQQERNKYLKVIFLALSLAVVYIILKTGSRTGLMILIVLLIGVLPKYASKHKVALILGGVVVFFLFSHIGGLNLKRFQSIPDSIRSFLLGDTKAYDEMDQEEQSAKDRRDKNHDAWGLIREYPLFGVGINPDEDLFFDRFPNAAGQVHCEILTAGKEMGIIGMTLYVMPLVILYKRGRNVQKATRGTWPAVSDMGWTLSMQAIVVAVGGSFSPLPWNAPSVFLVACASSLWNIVGSKDTPALTRSAQLRGTSTSGIAPVQALNS